VYSTTFFPYTCSLSGAGRVHAPDPEVRRSTGALSRPPAPAQHQARGDLLGISQRTVERYVKNQVKTPRSELADRLEHEVRARWQPQIRAKAKQTAAATGGSMIDVQGRFGYTAAPGSTDDARIRHLTLALPPQHAARLFTAREEGVAEDQLRQIAAEALGEVYFRDNGHRAQELEVELTDLIDLEFEL